MDSAGFEKGVRGGYGRGGGERRWSFANLKGTAGTKGFKIARKPSRDVRRSGRAAEIGGAVMQRVGAAGGPGPIGFQGPPRSLKISPVNIQDEPTDPTQSKYLDFLPPFRLSIRISIFDREKSRNDPTIHGAESLACIILLFVGVIWMFIHKYCIDKFVRTLSVTQL